MDEEIRLEGEGGLCPPQPKSGLRYVDKEGAHGGTMGSPVLKKARK